MLIRVLSLLFLGAWALVSSAHQAWGQTSAPFPPPAKPPTTLWSFLGIPQGCAKIHAQLFNRFGHMPFLEPKPPVRGIADPRNLSKGMPDAIKTAALIKQQEDLVPQKIKAVRYLAKIGYPGNTERAELVTGALLSALTDPNEQVRYATVKAIQGKVRRRGGGNCSECGTTHCCNEKILKALADIAYKRGPSGCYLEPSERVRRAAEETLELCCPAEEPIEIETEPLGRPEAPPDRGRAENSAQFRPTHQNAAAAAGLTRQQRRITVTEFANADLGSPSAAGTPASSSKVANVVSRSTPKVAVHVDDSPQSGHVVSVDLRRGVARVRLDGKGLLPQGTEVKVIHEYLLGNASAHIFIVQGWDPQTQALVITPRMPAQRIRIARGDEVRVIE